MLGLRKEQNPPPGSYSLHGSPNQAVAADRQNGRVGASTLSLPAYLLGRVGTRHVDQIFESEFFRYCKPLLVQIGSDYRRPCPFGQYTQYDADWPLTNHQNGFARLERHPLDSLHAGVHRFDKRSLLERDSLGNTHRSLLDDPIHHANVVGESAARRLKSGRASDLLVGLALRESFVPAVVALAAGDVMEDDDAVTGSKPRNAGADGRNHSRSLVPKNAWSRMGPGGDLLQIGSANAAVADFN